MGAPWGGGRHKATEIDRGHRGAVQGGCHYGRPRVAGGPGGGCSSPKKSPPPHPAPRASAGRGGRCTCKSLALELDVAWTASICSLGWRPHGDGGLNGDQTSSSEPIDKAGDRSAALASPMSSTSFAARQPISGSSRREQHEDCTAVRRGHTCLTVSKRCILLMESTEKQI